MKQQKTTHAKQTVRVVTNLEPALVEKIDRERAGICGRAAILRLAIVERYKRQNRSPLNRPKLLGTQEVAS